jgi:hypothetical protein
MKKLFYSLLLLTSLNLLAQETYWTDYAFNVEVEVHLAVLLLNFTND